MRAELIIFLFAVLLLQATAQNITCCGIDSTNNTVCSGNGQCVSNDSCVCSNNFTGSCCQECSTGFVLSSDLKRCEPSCFFVGSSNSSVCTGNGICVAVDTCQCKNGFSGPRCECGAGFSYSGGSCIPVCCSKLATDASVCNGGACISPNNCTCVANRTGSCCETCLLGFDLISGNCVRKPQVICAADQILQNDTCVARCSPGYYFDLRINNCSAICCNIFANNSAVCSGHGSCIAPNMCSCYGNYSGSCCAVLTSSNTTNNGSASCGTGFSRDGNRCLPICFNRTAADSRVCSRNGNCSSPDNCLCRPGYAGVDCSMCASGFVMFNQTCSISCFNISSNNPIVCSGNGRCLSTDVCTCNFGFTGRICNQSSLTCPPRFVQIGSTCQPLCFGRNATDELVCSGHGACVGVDLCSCYGGYNGTNCSIALPVSCPPNYGEFNRACVPFCFNILSSNASACSGHGLCIDVNLCTCDEGYYGNNCNISCPFGSRFVDGRCIFLCYGKLATNRTVCSGNGTCVGYNTCNCLQNYTGLECEKEKEIVCPPGFLLDTRTKSCITSCCGRPATDTFVCGGNGRCIGPGLCECRPGFSGACCLNYGTPCDTGFTYVNGSCQPSCCGFAASDSRACNGNGQCVGPNLCRCSSLFQGSCCTIRSQNCETGFTRVNGSCLPVCFGEVEPNRVCSGRGFCQAPNVCVCQRNFTGSMCSINTNCGLGFVSINATCIHTCFGIPATNSSVCSGNGTCTSIDTCSCTSEFMGSRCETRKPNCATGFIFEGGRCIPTCFGVKSTSPQVCSGRGTCTDVDACRCNIGSSGRNCTVLTPSACDPGFALRNNLCVPVCFGKAATENNVCNSQGVCISPNSCQCNSEYQGQECETKRQVSACPDGFIKDQAGACVAVCFGSLATNADVCSGNGICTGPNTCSCKQGFTGGNCGSRVQCGQGYSQTPDFKCIPLCFGKLKGQGACSNRGECVSPNRCNCSVAYDGDECETLTHSCYSIFKNDPTVCSGHGSCVALDACICNSSFIGERCSIRLNSTCSKDGFTGSDCSIAICYGIPANEQNVCSASGTCSSPNVCTCTAGFEGIKCEKKNTIIPNSSVRLKISLS